MAAGGLESLKHTGFNSRPCERGDLRALKKLEKLICFNSRPCERGDISMRCDQTIVNCFNSRPCERGDCSWFWR